MKERDIEREISLARLGAFHNALTIVSYCANIGDAKERLAKMTVEAEKQHMKKFGNS